MKICLVSPYSLSFPGGVQEHVKALAIQFRKKGHQAKIIAPASFWNEKSSDKDILLVGNNLKIPFNGTEVPITFGLNYSLRLWEIFEKEKFDLFHLHNPWTPTLSWFVMFHAKKPMVATFHTTAERIPKKQSLILEPLLRPIVMPLLEKIAGRIAVSQVAKTYIHGYLKGGYEVIPNGVDTKRFHPEVPPLKKFKDGKINILYVGRLEERKGLLYLLSAYKKIQGKTRLLVVGDGSLKKEAQKFTRDHRLKNVHFAGIVAPEILPSYYTTADIFCSPATHGESFGIVLLEAMASGLPIVASRISGYSELLKRDEGFLVSPKDSRELAKALKTLIKDGSLRQDLGENGFKTSKKYDWEIIGSKILNSYQKILKHPRR